MRLLPLPSLLGCRLWRVDLDWPLAAPERASLSNDECRRGSRFVFERDRRRHAAAHVALREALSTMTGTPPAAHAIARGVYGKPYLEAADAPPFNLSHSGPTGLIGCCEPGSDTGAVGVDIEEPRPTSYSAELADAHFSVAERRQLASAPASGRERAFLVGWTRKEACLKAVGFGLGIVDAREVEVGTAPDAGRVALQVDGRVIVVEIASFPVGASGIGAVARVRARPRQAPGPA